MKMFVHIAIVFVALFATSPLCAQVPKDPQSTYEPRSEPGAGQKFLAQLAGEWDVVKSFFPRSGEPARASGECHQTMIHDGRFLQSDFTFRTEGKTTTGMGLIGFDARSGLFTSVWTDSRSTRMSFRQSKDPFDGAQIVLFGQQIGDAGSNAPRSKTVTRLGDQGRKIVHQQTAVDTEGKERLVMEIVMTRKAGNPAAK